MEKVYKLAEVAAITGLPLETLKTDSKRGNLPTQLAPEGKKLVKVISSKVPCHAETSKLSIGFA